MALMTDTKPFNTTMELDVKYNKNSGELVSDTVLYDFSWSFHLSNHDSNEYLLYSSSS